MNNATRYHDADLDMLGNTILNASIRGYYTKTEVRELLKNTGRGHPSHVEEFGGDGQREYLIVHGLGSYNVVVQVRTVEPPIRYIFTDMVAVDENTLKVSFSEPLNQRMSISILACDMVAEPEGGQIVATKTITIPSTTWTYVNDTGRPMFCQLFDMNGNEIRGDVVQNSTENYENITVSMGSAYSGIMLVAEPSFTVPFSGSGMFTVDVLEHGYTVDDRFLVQIYVDGTGEMVTGIVPDTVAGTISINLGDSLVEGTVVFIKATACEEFADSTRVEVQHVLGRPVGVQVYTVDAGLVMAGVTCTDDDTVVISSDIPITGYVVIV